MIAALGIAFPLFLACYEILTGSVERLMGSIPPQGHGRFLHSGIQDVTPHVEPPGADESIDHPPARGAGRTP